MSSVDEVVLAWLVVRQQKPNTADLVKAVAPFLGGSAADPKNVVSDALGRLKAQGLIERDTRLMLTKEGRRRALAVLDVPELPKRVKADWRWAKKLFVLRRLDISVPIGKSASAAWLAKKVLISHHQLRVKEDAEPMEILAALAWRAIGGEEGESFTLEHLVGPHLLRGAPRPTDTNHHAGTPAAPPAADGLPGFAASVRRAAQASPTGRWHDNKVFISHVWNELRRQDGAGAPSFEEFQRRLIEANRAQLIELSRADLVQAMPREDVAASETSYLNASFHFVRLDDR